jgi:Ethanolamine utilization protein EutJ (predicted chaperonin)
MSSTSGKEQFMRQFDAIVEGVKQNKVKVSIRNIEISHLRVTHTCTKPGAGWLTCIHMARCRMVDVHTHGQVQDG